MSKRASQNQLVGEDSFLDVVANLVGVLIILVAVVSLQAGDLGKQSVAADSREKGLEEVEAALRREELAANAIRQDSQELDRTIHARQQAILTLEQIRHELLVQNAVVEKEIERRKSELSVEEKSRMDQVVQHQNLLVTVQRLHAQVSAMAAPRAIERKEIEHYPTPIAKTVFADEIHFRLLDGKINFVPIDSLLQKMKSQAETKVEELYQATEVSGTVGPEDGFQMEYRLAGEKIQRGDERGVQVRFLGFSLQPQPGLPGETLNEALAPESNFRARLRRMTPGKTTISIWVYPESFEEFLQLKTWLREQGFQIAGWPLESNAPISGGPNGFRTSAQ
jgi:hypothetical protein